MPRIFVSYRRADSRWATARLYDYLCQRFGSDHIFMDIDTIGPGEDFVQVIGDAVGACDAILIVMGELWLEATDQQGRRRLDDPNDYVRREVAAALEQGKLVIPVLIDGIAMPSVNDLPDDLALLAQRNALDLSRKRFQHDAERLVKALERPVAPAPAPSPPTQRKRRRLPLWLLIGGVALAGGVLLGVGLLVAGLLIGLGASSPEPTDVPLLPPVEPEAEATPLPPTPTDEVTDQPVEYSPLSDCATSRLRVGDEAYVSLDAGQNGIRSSSDNSVDNLIGNADPGEALTVIGGPECSFGWVMWEVETETKLVGWTPEGDGEVFWLVPGAPE